MGWLEVLAMLKRLLPLLSRVAPMLETYVAARGATRGDTEAIDRLSAELTTHFAAAAESGSGMRTALDAQGTRIQKLADELRHLRDADAARTVQLEQMERQIALSAQLVRLLGFMLVGLLLACAAMLVALLLRR